MTAATGITSLSYDANGNLSQVAAGTTSNYRFDAENRLISRGPTGSLTAYVYDGNGTMLKRTDPDGTLTTYVGGIFEKRVLGGSTTVTKYYAALGRVVAMRRRGPSDAANVAANYLLCDHLGGTVGLLDASGGLIAGTKTSYWPYGGIRSGGTTLTDKLFTGQQQEPGDAALGLYDYNARFYSTALGRFVSSDSVADGLNRFAYVGNNPLRYTDPSGHDCQAPQPCPSPLPDAGDHDAQDRLACRANKTACAKYAFALKFGVSPRGLVIVMGWWQSIDRNLDTYAGYGIDFLERYNPNCGARSDNCWQAFKQLVDLAGTNAAYDIFGIKFIESDPHGAGVAGAASALFGLGDQGAGELQDILDDPRGKNIVGVIGHSLGADTVATVFERNQDK